MMVGFPLYAARTLHAGGYLWAALALGSIVGTFALAGGPSPRRIALSHGIPGLSALAWPLAHALTLVGLTRAPRRTRVLGLDRGASTSHAAGDPRITADDDQRDRASRRIGRRGDRMTLPTTADAGDRVHRDQRARCAERGTQRAAT